MSASAWNARAPVIGKLGMGGRGEDQAAGDGGVGGQEEVEAAEATQYIKPKLAIPYHWGQSVGTLSDAQTFGELARCAVKILSVGETISSDNWPEYSPLLAHWKLCVDFLLITCWGQKQKNNKD